MELAIALVVVALFVVGSLVPRNDLRPWQGGFVLAADAKEAINIVYRIWATWRIERVNLDTCVLTQHFEVLKDDATRVQIKKML